MLWVISNFCIRCSRYSANFSKAILAMNMIVKCVFCGDSCSRTCCQSCSVTSRIDKFSRLLGRFEAASHSNRYHDEIVALVERSRQVREKNYIDEFFFAYLESQPGRTTSFYTGAIIRWGSSSRGSCCSIIFEEGQWLSERCIPGDGGSRRQLPLPLSPPSHERSDDRSG